MIHNTGRDSFIPLSCCSPSFLQSVLLREPADNHALFLFQGQTYELPIYILPEAQRSVQG